MINAAVAFGLELSMLAAFGYWGYKIGNGLVVKWLLALALPLIAGVLWGYVLAPKAPYRLDTNIRVVVELMLFLLAAYALYRLGHATLAVVFAALAVIVQVLFLTLGEWKP